MAGGWMTAHGSESVGDKWDADWKVYSPFPFAGHFYQCIYPGIILEFPNGFG